MRRVYTTVIVGFCIWVFCITMAFSIEMTRSGEETGSKTSSGEDVKENESEKAKREEKETNAEGEQVPAATGRIGAEGGKIAADNLPLTCEVSFDEKSFDGDATITIYRLQKEIGLEAYDQIGPVWYIKSDTRFIKRGSYTFEFEDIGIPKGSLIVVLTWWRGRWVVLELPKIDLTKNRVTIEADYPGYFVPVRAKSRREVDIPKAAFYDGEKRKLEVIGIFHYSGKFREGEAVLEETLHFRERFLGDIAFGPIPGSRRTGVKVLYGQSKTGPKVLSFQSQFTLNDEVIFATGHEPGKDRGVVSAQLEGKSLNFLGQPNVVRLTGIRSGKKWYLPTRRGNLIFEGIHFDETFQDMFQLKSFLYFKEITMPHGMPDERTVLSVIFQFIVH